MRGKKGKIFPTSPQVINTTEIRLDLKLDQTHLYQL